MKALVTGGAGFIGSHLVDRLIDRQYNVVILDNLSTSSITNISNKAELIVGDICSYKDVARATKDVDVIFHLAAVSSVQDSILRPVEVNEVNIKSAILLLEAARKNKVKRFVFSSSAAVYGDISDGLAKENMHLNPLSHYAVQKMAVEKYCFAYNRLYGIPTVSLRYFNVFGPRQRCDSAYSGVIPKFIAAAHSSEPIIIYGDGSQTRDFCHVANVVEANVAACECAEEKVTGLSFNVGTGESISIKELAEIINKLSNRHLPINYKASKLGEIKNSLADIKLIKKKMGYKVIENFRNGIEKTYKTFKH